MEKGGGCEMFEHRCSWPDSMLSKIPDIMQDIGLDVVYSGLLDRTALKIL